MESWVPGGRTSQDIFKEKQEKFNLQVEEYVKSSDMALAVIDEIDQMEEDYLNEYEKLFVKDTENNKDFNMLALEELKQARYFFAYLRTQEKLSTYERKK